MLGGLDPSLVKLKDFALCRDACAAHVPNQQQEARLAYIRSLADVAADEDISVLKVHHLFDSRPNKNRKRSSSGVGEVEAPEAKKE